MSKYRTAYAPEFRQQLIELVHAGRSANDVAKEFGLHATTVAKWVRLSPRGAPAAPPLARSNASQGPLNAAERQELVVLRRNMRCRWIWVLLSADAHIVNRSTVDFATRQDCVADADLNGFCLPDAA